MLRSIVPQVVTLETPKYDTVRRSKAGGANLRWCRPAGRPIGRRGLGFARPPHRHGNGNRDRDESTGRRDVGTLNEDLRRIGVIGVPPPEERRWEVDRYSRHQLKPWLSELRLITELPGHPLRRGPHCRQHDREDEDDLPPENFGRRHDDQGSSVGCPESKCCIS